LKEPGICSFCFCYGQIVLALIYLGFIIWSGAEDGTTKTTTITTLFHLPSDSIHDLESSYGTENDALSQVQHNMMMHNKIIKVRIDTRRIKSSLHLNVGYLELNCSRIL